MPLTLMPHEVLRDINNIQGTKNKEKFIKDNDTPYLQYVLEHAVSPYITFGVKQYSFAEPLGICDYNDPNAKNAIQFICHNLKTRSLTGHSALEAIKKASAQLDAESQYMLACILDKDLKCGIGTKTIQKVFPGLIPSFEVQLAKKDMSKITYPCMAEIKSNGRRNIAIVNGIEVKHFSRNGKEQPNFSCFDEELIQISLGQTVVFDGEVRGRDGDHKSQYKESQKQARRKTNVDTSRLQYVVWDMMPLCDFKMKTCDRTQSKRYDFLRDCVLEYQHTASKGGVNQKIFKVDISKSVTIENEKELKKHFSKVTRKGEEGLIVKNMSGMYEFKRSDTWIKMKLENDVDLKIVGVKEGKKSLKGHLGSVSVMHGKTKVDCPCGKGITRAIAKKLWKNSKELIGKIAKIEYMNVTEDNSLFLPKFVEVRDDKDVSDKPIKKKKKVNKVETKKKKKKKKKA